MALQIMGVGINANTELICSFSPSALTGTQWDKLTFGGELAKAGPERVLYYKATYTVTLPY